ncbi:hypothetical protein KKF91_08000 [Myxococcota bacterium]|nr:hypothetical protein [Myxococcota bacterium]MBU1430486.1 hypothetical protein [Myxococcota bacterium]MBU1899090.1 hypothetical protein [Myxococcota bacterium]
MSKTKQRIHEILAVEPEIKGNAERARSHTVEMFRSKQSHFNGMRRTFKLFAVNEDQGETGGERLEAETRLVTTVMDELRIMLKAVGEAINIGYTIDEANTRGRADIVVDDEVLLKGVPATFLLQLEKRLKEIRTVLKEIPCFDPIRLWTEDKGADREHVLRAEPVVTIRKQRARKYNVMYEATKEHPAQVDVMEIDEPIGEIRAYDWTGMLAPRQKHQLIERLDALIQAVKAARARANEVEAEIERQLSKALFDYLLRPIS